MRAVLALGGNALQQSSDDGGVEGELRRARTSLAPLARLLAGREKLLLTHGNGPQVGHALLRAEAGLPETPERPLDHLVSDTQGGLGYLLERTVREIITTEGGKRDVMTMLAQVEVVPELGEPRKPIGPWYPLERRAELEKRNWVLATSEKGVRRLVASPEPQRVLELDIIRSLFENRVLCITAGGGGTPVVRDGDGWRGVEGVIDKDLVAGLLAQQLNATHLIIATDVEHVWVGPEREPLGVVTIGELRSHYEAGEFPDGSMGPKVHAALDFVRNGGQEAIISSTAKITAALAGEAGTRVVA
ncbi:MAG: carbamate kinase [Candidatus Thermoplasmatota archaeon]|nr:carbamate kinase [Candidatus Thermoplasmatota archaeon]